MTAGVAGAGGRDDKAKGDVERQWGHSSSPYVREL